MAKSPLRAGRGPRYAPAVTAESTRSAEGTARALWLEAPGRYALRPAEAPPPASGEARVEATTSGISRGTERLVFEGRVPTSQHERMRAPRQEGAFPAPVKYGYASVGVVTGLGEGAGMDLAAGRRVFCLHPHQSAYTVPADALVPVPDEVSDARAVLAANMETALNGCWDAGLTVGQRVVVVGAGVLGLLVASLARATPGTEVTLVDPSPARRAPAEALGLMRWRAPADLAGDADLVVHTSATGAGLQTALAAAGTEATVLELSWFGDRSPALPLGEAFHSRRLRLVSSQVGRVAALQRSRWSRRERLALALRLLADPRYEALVAEEIPFADAPARLPEVLSVPGTLAARLRYR